MLSFPTKKRRNIVERNDLSPPVVPGGDEIGSGYRNLRPRNEGHAPRGAPSPRAAKSLGRTHRPRLPGVRLVRFLRATSCQHAPCVPRALCPSCSVTQGQVESWGMVLVAYAGPVRPAAALRDSVLCLPTDIHSDIHSLLVNKPSFSSSSSSSTQSFSEKHQRGCQDTCKLELMKWLMYI